MNTKSMISNELREMYGFLFHEVRELDRNCHSFCVVWSADGGFTRLSIDLMLDKCVGADLNLTHPADPILTRGWELTA